MLLILTLAFGILLLRNYKALFIEYLLHKKTTLVITRFSHMAVIPVQAEEFNYHPVS